jgi:hypothetical protein
MDATTSRRQRKPDDVRRELEDERRRLAESVEELRKELGQATDVAGKLRGKLPAVAAGALGLGFVAAGGIGATARLLMRRSREGETKAKLGRFRVSRES